LNKKYCASKELAVMCAQMGHGRLKSIVPGKKTMPLTLFRHYF